MEPTANEMLSDVVPSNGMDAQSAIDKVISQRQAQNVGQTETGLDEAQSAINTVIQQRKSPKTQLNSTFASVSGINPDDAAKAQQVGGAIGLGQDLTMRNAAEVKRIADQKRFEMYDLMESDPILGRQMMRREFASVAHDDIPQLTSVGALFKVAYSAATLSPFPKDVALEISQQYEGTQYQTEEALIYHWMNNNNLEEKDLSEETRKRLKFLEQNAPPPINTYLFGGLSYAAGQARSMAPEVAKYAIAGGVTYGALGLAGGPLAPATVAGGVLTGIGLGATAGVGVVTSQIESGMLYKDLLRSGVPKETARTASRIGGTISGLIEMGTLGLAVAPFKMVIKKTVGDVIATRLEKTTVGSAVKTAGKYYAMSEGGEQIEELSQYATAVAVEEFAKSFTDSDYVTIFETPEGRKKFIEQMVDISYQTWKATAIIGSFGPVLNLAVDAKNIRDSAKTKQFLTDLSKNVQATKLKGRSPSALANFVAAQAQGTAAETMYVDAEEMTNVLNQSGLTAQQINNALPGVREQLAQATSGGDIQIPTAQFAANIVGTKLEAPLMEHARLAPDAISAKQAIVQQETMQQNMKDAQVEMAVQEVTNAQFVREAKEIEKVVNDQLVAAGRPPTEALFAAKLVQARAVTGAAAAGITPAQWVAQHPVPTFQSQRQAAQAAQQAPAQGSLEQAVTQETLAALTNEELDKLSDYAYEIGAIQSDLDAIETEIDGRFVEKDDAETIPDKPAKLEDPTSNTETTGLGIEELMRQSAAQGRLNNLTPEQLGASIRSDGDIGLLSGLSSNNFNKLNEFTDQELGIEAYAALDAHKAQINLMKDRLRARVLQQAPAQGSFEQASRADLGLSEQAAFNEASHRPEVVTWAKEKFGDRTAPDGSSVWQNFTEWFGDSKVVDAEGKPIMAYHATHAKENFTEFKVGEIGIYGRGIYFSTSIEEINQQYLGLGYERGRIVPAYLTIKNPLITTHNKFERSVADALKITESQLSTIVRNRISKGELEKDIYTDLIKESGHDGVEIAFPGRESYFVAFEPTQIKSAIANVGTFGQQDPNILRQAAVPATAMPSVTTDNPVSPIGLAITSASSKEVKSIEESDTFFKKVWKKLLIASGKQMRSKSDESVKEAAKMAVADIQDFVKNNPQFSDYYSQDWMKTRSLLDEYAGRAITDDEFQMYRVICGLTSPNTQLPSNISDTVKLWTHWMENGSFDGFLLGPKPVTGKSVVFESDEIVSGTTANTKIRTVKIIAQLVKELGSVKAAIDFLREPVTGAELNKVNKSLGYAGNVSKIGNIKALVKMATGQDKLIPRMFIFGQKVGAYTLNAVGDERFTTVDIWESRYIRSFFSGMFENEIGLPTDEKEHDTFVRFGYAFKDEMERVTGRTWTPSSLQALRWFYIIAATRSAGYSKASTNETISTYTSRVLQKQFDYNQSRKLNATRSTTTPPRRIVPQKYERDLNTDLDAKGITDPKQRQQIATQSWIQFARSNSESDPVGFQFDTNRSGVPRRSGPLKGLATVATHTPGSQLAKAFAKAGSSIQPYVELAQTEVGAKAFSDRVRAINANSKFSTAVYVYSDAEYMGKRLFISESGKSGFALSSDGDIVSVFSEAGSREGRGAMALATQMGGTKLDCFDTVLPGYYAAHGFRAVARVKWSDEYTPTGWDFNAFAQFNGGRPDVVYMVYEANHFDSYSNKDGVVVADPSEAVAIQTQDIKSEQDRVAANKARYAEVIKPSQTLFQSAVPATFYSALGVEVGKSTTKSASADSWKQQIKGLIAKGVVKEKEVYWSGLDNWLDLQEGKITKEQVQAFLDTGGVKVEVVRLDQDVKKLDRSIESGTAYAKLQLEENGMLTPKLESAFAELEQLNATNGDRDRRLELHSIIDKVLVDVDGMDLDAYIETEDSVDDPSIQSVKYEGYQLPGGTNYREALVTLPSDALGTRKIMEGDKVVAIAKNDPYRSAHWNQENVLVHLRMNDRVDADGKKVLFVEEVQSDWGQAGREKGFVDFKEKAALEKEGRELVKQSALKRDEALQALGSWRNAKWEQMPIPIKESIPEILDMIASSPVGLTVWANELGIESDSDIAIINDYIQTAKRSVAVDIQLTKGDFGIPTAPFVETTSGWLELGLKQILLEAVNGGYDKVAFVDGDQSVQRYRKALTEAVDEVEITRNDDGTYTYSAIKGGKPVQGEQSVSANRINEVFGKAGSKQLLEEADAKPDEIHTIASGDIEIGGEGMRKFYDTIVPQALGKMLKKLGGDKVGEVEIDTRRPEDNAYYADLTEADTMRQQGFTVTPALAEQVSQGLPLFQAAEGGARGEYDPIKNLIGIGKNADYSTVAHELAHWYVVDLFRTASESTASEASRSDADILLKWFGIAGDNVDQRLANWNAMTLDEQRRHHEAVAYNWELYLHTGKAPSVELQGVFDRFRRWLTRAYKSIRDDLNEIYRLQFGTDLPFMTDEVRGVFDRMLASEEQIARREAIDNFKGMYQTQEESGMNDATWAAYQAEIAEAHEMAVTDLTKATVKQMEWLSGARKGILKAMQAAHNALRRSVQSEESNKMDNEPVRKAERFFKTGRMVDPDGKEIEVLVGNKIDSVAVGGMYPTSTTGLAPAVDLTKLRGMTMEGGLAPDLAAEMFGFSSGDELIRALAELKPFKDELKERTDARMLDEHGGMNTEAEKEEAVNKALANEVRARMVAIENRYLTKVKTPVAVIMQGAKELARTILGRMAIKDIKPRNYVAAEARVAKDKHTAVKAMQSPETAGKSAYTRSFNEQIAAGVEESAAASEALVKSVEAIKRAQAKIDAHKKQYGDVDPAIVAAKASHQQVIQGQLAKEGYKILDEVDKALAYVKRIISDANRKKMGADHADQIEAILERFGLMGRYVAPTTRTPLATWAQTQQDIGFDIEIPDIVQESVRKNFLELTPEEFQDVIDTVKQIAHTGKNQQLVLTMDRKITFEKAKTEIVESINANAGGRKAKTRTATTNIGRTIETLTGFFAAHLKAAIVAQIMDGGKDGGPLWNYLIRSANTAGNKETTMRAAATKRISEILDPVFKGGKMGGAGVYFPSVDRSFNRESVLTIALNMGNESNMQRLLDGEGWTIEQVMPIIQSLTAAELNAVQEVWDYSETFKAEIIEKSRRTVGREPNWIEPKPLQVMSADGQMVSLKGGYYPVKYDPRASARSQSLSAADQALRDLKDAHIASTTRRSYTKSRVKEVHDRPLLLNLSGLYSGIGEVIHDLSWHEWLIDSNRLMRSSAFDKAVREQYGVEFKDQITAWIKDVAAGDKPANNAGEMALNYLRQGVSAAGLGFNLISAASQITGFSQAVVKVGAKWIGRGIAASASNPKAAIERVYALSSFMTNRGSTQFRELNEIKNMVRGDNVAMKRVKAGTYFLMMQMQRMVDIPTWIGAYEKQLSINSDEKLAIAIADQAVIDSQGGGMLKDLSAIERGGPIQKLFTVFYSFMNTNLNLAVLKGMTEKNAGKYVAQQIMLWVVPVVSMYMLKKLLTPQVGDDDEGFDLKEMAKELAAEELSFLMGSFMVVREFADAAKIVTGAKTYGTDYRGPAGLRMIGDTYKFATQAAQLEFDTAFRKAAINIIGSSSGLPSAQINRTIDGIEALFEGETENITAPLFGVKKR